MPDDTSQIENGASPKDNPKPKQRFFYPRFSVRTIFVIVALLALGFGWFIRFDQVRRSVNVIEGAGGRITYESDMRSLKKLGKVETWLRETLPKSYYTNVKFVDLGPEEEEINDRVLSHLSSFKHLRGVGLCSEAMSDDLLKHISSIETLESVVLNTSPISNAGLKHLEGLKSLQRLWVGSTKMDDDAVEQFSKFHSLKSLWIDKPYLSDDAIKKLRKLLPNCEITAGAGK